MHDWVKAMKNKESNHLASGKKQLLYLGILGLLIALTCYYFLKGNDLAAIFQALRHANLWYILLAVVTMSCFIACESVNIKMMLKVLGKPTPFFRCLKYSYIGFYFSSITPSASGGQPAQVYYMHKDRIGVSLSTLILLVIVVCYQIAMVLYGGVVALMQLTFSLPLVNKLKFFLLYGVGINLVLIGLILCIVFNERIPRAIAHKSLQFLNRLHLVKDLSGAIQRVDRSIEEYKQAAQLLRKNKWLFVRLLLVTFLQLTALYLVPYLVARAFGTEHTLWQFLCVQSLLQLSVASLPLPGAAGASEGVFMLIYRFLFPAAFLLPAMLLWRGITFYLFLLIGGAVCAGAQILVRRQKRRGLDLSRPLPKGKPLADKF